ncbi:T9SS type A sorting domain-containing protein [Gaetbulibacter sp. M235]|uniref:T9SS type A sorting domain-containing protein n=1 Tax=Gaetbulibacter sp. M235 TaxID=3126510 RepID=UPI00374F4721
MKTNLLSIFIVGLFLTTSNLISQVMLREIPLKQQIENASLVVEGKVLSKKSFWDVKHEKIYTANTIEVYKVFKGEPVATIDVITKGGVVGTDFLIVSSASKIKENDKGVFMLQNTNIGHGTNDKIITKKYKPYGAVQGFYKYDLYSDIAVNPFNKKQGIFSSFYNEIMDITKTGFVEVAKYNVSETNKSLNVSKALGTPIVSSFNPTTLTAGTKSQLTINGSGFGSSGKVSFPDANNGGFLFTDALASQIVSWSDTQIVVEVPSDAGTGKFRVTNDDSPTPLSRVASTDLTISYSESNIEYDPGTGLQAYPLQHYDENGNGGYEWEMQTDFFNDTEHPGAKASFERAMDTWRCNTKINWTIANSATNIDVVARDGTNIVRFDNGDELETGVLGECSYWPNYYTGCAIGESVQFYVKELEIVFDDATSWYFGTGDPGLNYDFESVAVHELGHGHLLGHVIDTNAIMHYNLGLGEFNRILSINDINAGLDVQSRSTSTSVCGTLDPMTDYTGTCNLSVDDIAFNEAVKVYPNPSNGQFYINNKLGLNLTKAVVFDMSGRLISVFDILNSSNTKQINLTGLSKGIYLVNIHSNYAFVTKKLVLE